MAHSQPPWEPAWATSHDNGGILGGDNHIPVRTDMGIDGLILGAVQLGIYNHKGPWHLYGSYCLVTIELAIGRIDRASRARLHESLEVPSTSTPPPLPCDRVMFVDHRHFLGTSQRAITADAAA